MDLRREEDLDEELIDTEDNNPQTINPKKPTFSDLPEMSDLPPEAYPYEDPTLFSTRCLKFLDELNLAPHKDNSGVYSVCSNILLLQHEAAVEYSKEFPDKKASFEDFKDKRICIIQNSYRVIQSKEPTEEEIKLNKHNLAIVSKFSNFVEISNALEGRSNRIVGGTFDNRVAVLASMINFIVRTEQLASKWEKTSRFYEFSVAMHDKYLRYIDSFKMNITENENERAGLEKWLAEHFPRNVMYMWPSSMKSGPQPTL